ncbi:diacylglycerol kinase family lipid kinase [Fulvivirgaceae bacterium BMA10]|uniref:Diacylglycerol kinase family lipid kinase n=1 Tax=Splendidivirga corallicola TaxID=3051826 RepID=A0ABT8KIQ2_9BACT|nr:diacylglycerol kinase family lipid kinase [Fulvivirgaceae bacterium BMA10]
MQSRKKILFIINPISGVSRKFQLPLLIESHLNHDLFDSRVEYTKRAHHATELSKQAADEGYYAVAAVGGDGTVNEVSRGLIGSQTALIIVPVGSGNGAARHLNIPLRPKKAIKLINTAKKRVIDTALINELTFINMAGIGFDARVGWLFSKSKIRGLWPYLKIGFREFFQYNEEEYDIRVDGQEIKSKALLVSVANSAQYGFNAIIAPEAVMDDNFLNLCILRKPGIIKGLNVLVRLFSGTINKSDLYKSIKGKEINIRHNGQLAHIDGEPIELNNELNIKIQPESLYVIC